MLKAGPRVVLKTGPSFSLFSPFLKCFLGMFKNTNSVTVCQNSVFAKLWGCQNDVFEKKIAFVYFCFLCWRNRNRKIKTKWKKAKKPYKNSFFKVVIQKCEKSKNWSFSKNCLTLFVSGREKNVHFRAHYLFWPKMFWTQTVRTGKHYETLLQKVCIQRKLPKTKSDTFFF